MQKHHLFFIIVLVLLVSSVSASDNGVNFVGSPRGGNAPLSVGFTDLSTIANRNITDWNWTFGNGYYSTTQNPFHIYTSSGDYTVTLSVNTTNLINSSFLNATKTNYIHVTSSSVAGLSSTIPMLPAASKLPAPVQFIDDKMLWVVVALVVIVGWLVIRRR